MIVSPLLINRKISKIYHKNKRYLFLLTLFSLFLLIFLLFAQSLLLINEKHNLLNSHRRRVGHIEFCQIDNCARFHFIGPLETAKVWNNSALKIEKTINNYFVDYFSNQINTRGIFNLFNKYVLLKICLEQEHFNCNRKQSRCARVFRIMADNLTTENFFQFTNSTF